jgi:hypothetical protein
VENGWKWKVLSIGIFFDETPHAWYVTYQAVPIAPKEGPVVWHEVTLVVLFDGTVIEPVVADDESAKKSQD